MRRRLPALSSLVGSVASFHAIGLDASAPASPACSPTTCARVAVLRLRTPAIEVAERAPYDRSSGYSCRPCARPTTVIIEIPRRMHGHPAHRERARTPSSTPPRASKAGRSYPSTPSWGEMAANVVKSFSLRKPVNTRSRPVVTPLHRASDRVPCGALSRSPTRARNARGCLAP